jgi:hypothetical protein
LKTKHLPAHALQRKETNSQKNHVCVPLDWYNKTYAL